MCQEGATGGPGPPHGGQGDRGAAGLDSGRGWSGRGQPIYIYCTSLVMVMVMFCWVMVMFCEHAVSHDRLLGPWACVGCVGGWVGSKGFFYLIIVTCSTTVWSALLDQGIPSWTMSMCHVSVMSWVKVTWLLGKMKSMSMVIVNQSHVHCTLYKVPYSLGGECDPTGTPASVTTHLWPECK